LLCIEAYNQIHLNIARFSLFFEDMGLIVLEDTTISGGATPPPVPARPVIPPKRMSFLSPSLYFFFAIVHYGCLTCFLYSWSNSHYRSTNTNTNTAIE
jgi:hypothetical protein